ANIVRYPDQPVIPKTEQTDFRADAPRIARKSVAVARDEESRRRNGGHLAWNSFGAAHQGSGPKLAIVSKEARQCSQDAVQR
ncbi:MAG TPA: hypothetical protein VHX49_02165, partial [Candidatus Acidoferrales bacterium]|nr:hypothetical protein [Candidatus Acidoferrales bacterium]